MRYCSPEQAVLDQFYFGQVPQKCCAYCGTPIPNEQYYQSRIFGGLALCPTCGRCKLEDYPYNPARFITGVAYTFQYPINPYTLGLEEEVQAYLL